MKTVTFREFGKNPSKLRSQPHYGEALVIIRCGKPIAEVSPSLFVRQQTSPEATGETSPPLRASVRLH